MTFVSYEFGIAFAVCLLLCAVVFGRFGWRSRVLCVISMGFLWYAGGLWSIFWYGLSAYMVWAGARWIDRKQGKRSGTEKAVFWTVLGINFMILAVFRYINFPGYTMQELCWIAGKEYAWEPVSLKAPAGISFYTLTLTGYLIEVFWGSIPAEKSFWKVALFGGFFPQMSVGPIARYESLSETLFAEKPIRAVEVRSGLYRIVWGLFQKLVISERLAVLVNTVYGDTVTYSGSYLIVAAVCFALQLYTDFSGAIDVAVGLAQMLGVRLEENFRSPFSSRSVAEFWRRWHITLGGWFKDFVMYPLLKTDCFQKLGSAARKRLGKKTGKKVPTVVGLFVVWFLLGLWHGGEWTFIIGSGLYHAALMSLSLFCEPFLKRINEKLSINPEHPVWILFQRVRTFILVAVGFVFFRSDSLAMAADIFRGMVSCNLGAFSWEGLCNLGLVPADLAVLAVSLLISGLMSQRKEQGEKGFPLCLGLAFLVIIFGYYGHGYDASAFIYSAF